MAQSVNRIFFLPISETEVLFQSTEKKFPKKTIAPLQVKWMFPNIQDRCELLVK